MLMLLFLAAAQASVAVATAAAAAGPTLLFVCAERNDMLAAARKGALPTKVFATVAGAVAAGGDNDGLFVLAEAMLPSNPGKPQTASGTNVTEAEWAAIRAKKLSVYLEFPGSLPGGAPLPVAQTVFERVVVSAKAGLPSGAPPAALGHLRLLHPHKLVDFAVLPAALLPKADLALAKVAGYDTAVFGLPPANETHPFLVAASPELLVAATQLSYCRRRRFAPSDRWMAVVAHIFGVVSGGHWKPSDTAEPLWVPAVGPSFGKQEALPADAERQVGRDPWDPLISLPATRGASRSCRNLQGQPALATRSLSL